MELFSLIVLLLCFLGLSWFAGTDAPYVPTKMDLIPWALKKSGVKKGKTFYELGSGDGRVVYLASELGADSFGVEQSWLRVLYSRYKTKKLHLPNAHFIHGDLFNMKFSEADIIYAFLLQPAISDLESKLKRELKKGSVVITQRYHFQYLKPTYQKGELNIYTF
jgi:SAM-dependent methyltransferase